MEILNYLIIAVFGLIVGSFLGAFTYRYPRNISIKKGRSFCPNCKNKIAWFDNIPLLSFLFLGGKCRSCNKSISIRYPLIESFTALTFVSVYYFFYNCYFGGVFGFNFLSPICSLKNTLGVWLVPLSFLIASLLIAILVIDFENQIIPDRFVFVLLALAAFLLVINPGDEIYAVFFAAFLSSLFFLSLYLITKGKGMGAGDIKLVLALSLFLSWQYSVLYLFLSFTIGAFLGLILIAFHKASFGKHIPFAPFIIISFLATFLFGDRLIKFLMPMIL